MPPKRTAAAKSSAPAQRSGVKRPAESDAESDGEYRQRRQRNNIAVRKSREKSRAHAQMTTTKVEELRQENTQLEGRINVLTKELDLLKELLVLRAGKKGESDNSEDGVTSQPPIDTDSGNVATTSDFIDQDHGYVTKFKRKGKHS